MSESSEINNKKIVIKLIFWGVTAFIFSYFIYQLSLFIGAKSEIDKKIKNIESEKIIILSKIDSIDNVIKQIKTSDYMVEKIAREKLGMARPGEEIIRFKIK